MHQLAADTQDEIVRLYTSGVNAKRTGEAVGASKAAVLAALRRRGVTVRKATCPDPTPIGPEREQLILDVYGAGADAMETARRVSVNQSTVLNVLKRHGVRSRTLEEVTRNPAHNHDYFDSIDTDAKAWALGLIASDGNVSRKGNCIKLCLKATDADAVEKLRDLLCPTSRVVYKTCPDSRTKKPIDYAILYCASKPMVDALARNGIGPAKSKTLMPWDGPAHLMPAYWRGMLDGDGSWRHYARKGRVSMTSCVSLTGTKEVCEAFAAFVRGIHDCHPTVCRCKTVWVCMVGSSWGTRAVAEAVYRYQTVCLNRKRAIADTIMAHLPNTTR